MSIQSEVDVCTLMGKDIVKVLWLTTEVYIWYQIKKRYGEDIVVTNSAGHDTFSKVHAMCTVKSLSAKSTRVKTISALMSLCHV